MTIVRDLTFQDPADANLWVFLCYDENNTGAQGLSSASPLCPADGQGPLPECKTRGNIVEKIFNNAAATAWVSLRVSIENAGITYKLSMKNCRPWDMKWGMN